MPEILVSFVKLSLKIQKYNINRYDKNKNLNKFNGCIINIYMNYMYVKRGRSVVIMCAHTHIVHRYIY
jgi:hypothetical protein